MKYLKKYNESKYLSKNGKEFDCSDNKLKELPPIPETVEILYCYGNNLSKLPELPKGLKRLDCDNNNLPYSNLEEYKQMNENNRNKYLRKFKHFENIQDDNGIEDKNLLEIEDYVNQCDDAEVCTKYLQDYVKENPEVKETDEWRDIISIWHDKFEDEIKGLPDYEW